MNDHDDLSTIDFGSTMKNNFFLNISFGIKKKKSNLTTNDNNNDCNNDEQRQSIVKCKFLFLLLLLGTIIFIS